MIAHVLQYARRHAGFSQRELAHRCSVAQPSIARIESGRTCPRLDTAQRLLEACGFRLALEPLPGRGVDRTSMRRLLQLSPRERLERAAADAAGLARLEGAVRREPA